MNGVIEVVESAETLTGASLTGSTLTTSLTTSFGSIPDNLLLSFVTKTTASFEIPISDVEGITPTEFTPLAEGDLAGVALNGVPFYTSDPSDKTKFFYTTRRPEDGYDTLLGFAVDGHPIYSGPEDPTAATDLDAQSGRFSTTADYPGGVYHYVLNSDSATVTHRSATAVLSSSSGGTSNVDSSGISSGGNNEDSGGNNDDSSGSIYPSQQ